jgi:hypothetical protein
MPVSALWRWLGRRDNSPRWGFVARQFLIAVGIVAAMTATFWALDLAFVRHEMGEGGVGPKERARMLRVTTLLLTLGVLATVLGAMHALRVFLGRS